MSCDSPLTVVTPEKFRADMLRLGDPDLIAQVDAYFAARKNRSPCNTNLKRTGDGSIAQQPAKRQSNVVASSNHQSSTTVPSKTELKFSQPQAVQSPEVSHASNHDVEEIKRRIAQYKSQLQDLEDEHASLSRDRDPEIIKRLEKTLNDTAISREDACRKASQSKKMINQISQAILDGGEIVPMQLHQILQESRADHKNLSSQKNKLIRLQADQTMELREAERNDSKAVTKLESLDGEIGSLKLNLQNAERHLDHITLQRRLKGFGHVNVFALPSDQRLQLAKLAGQMQSILDEISGTPSV